MSKNYEKIRDFIKFPEKSFFALTLRNSGSVLFFRNLKSSTDNNFQFIHCYDIDLEFENTTFVLYEIDKIKLILPNLSFIQKHKPLELLIFDSKALNWFIPLQ